MLSIFGVSLVLYFNNSKFQEIIEIMICTVQLYKHRSSICVLSLSKSVYDENIFRSARNFEDKLSFYTRLKNPGNVQV